MKSGWTAVLPAAVILVGAAICIVGCAKKLNDADKKLLDQAAEIVKSDDKTKYPEAEKIYEDLKKRNPEVQDVTNWYAQMLLAWGDALQQEAMFIKAKGEALGEQVDKAQEEIDAQKGKRANPKAPSAEQEAAKAEFDKQRGKLADIKKIFDKWQNDAAAVLNRAFTLIKDNVEAGPQNYMTARVLADYYRIKGVKPKALETLDIVAQENPNSTGLRFIKGAIAMTFDNKPDDAIKFYEEALKMDPKFTKAKYYLALAFDKKGDAAAAQKAMKEVLEMSPNHVGAKTYLQMTDYVTEGEKAIDRYKKAEQNAAGDEGGTAAPAPGAPAPAAPAAPAPPRP